MDTGKAFDLTGRAALVTGGGSGIGRDCAAALAGAGANVMVVGRRLAKLEEVKAEIESAGGVCQCFSADLTDEDACVEKFGCLDVLVNSAGGGSIINIASLVALRASGPIVYSAAKGAVKSMGRTLAKRFGGMKIRVNTIYPGFIVTEMTAGVMDHPEVWAKYEAESPLGLLGQAEDIAYCALYLASDAARFVTGQDCHTACDHYHRYKEDVALMREMGLRSYRFSISWPRIMPEKGKVNPKGIEFYENLVAELKNAGIEPLVTLYHWDMPLWVHEEGGWRSPKIIDYFLDYVKAVVEALSGGCGTG